MKILFVIENFPLVKDGAFEITGGVERVALGAARHLAKKHDVTVITDRRNMEGEIKKDGFRIITAGPEAGYKQAGGLAKRRLFQKAALKTGLKLDLDIVFGWNFVSYSPAYKIAKRKNIPAIAWYPDVWLGRWIKLFGVKGIIGEITERLVLARNWSAFVAISDWTRDLLIKHGVNAEKISLIPPEVTVEKSTTTIKKKRNKNRMELVIASRLVKYKRVDLLLEALSLLSKKNIPFHATVTGAGPEENKLKQKAVKLGIDKNLTWLGFVENHSELLRHISAADLYLSASEIEGFGITTIEAAGCGTPFVAADIPAVRFATQKGTGGILFEKGNAAACAEAVETLLQDRKTYSRKTEECKTLFNDYKPSKILPKFDKLIEKLAK